MAIREDIGKDSDVGNWRLSQACVDYIVYVHALPVIGAARWRAMVERMRRLGICQDTSIGVATVRGSWGFFQIPGHGFPELKATFFQISKNAERRRLLMDIADILEMER